MSKLEQLAQDAANAAERLLEALRASTPEERKGLRPVIDETRDLLSLCRGWLP
jgi:hypothetical protein